VERRAEPGVEHGAVQEGGRKTAGLLFIGFNTQKRVDVIGFRKTRIELRAERGVEAGSEAMKPLGVEPGVEQEHEVDPL
jgi:hypothetical protein